MLTNNVDRVGHMTIFQLCNNEKSDKLFQSVCSSNMRIYWLFHFCRCQLVILKLRFFTMESVRGNPSLNLQLPGCQSHSSSYRCSLYTVQYQARTANIFGEMCELFLDGTVRGNNNRNKAYSRKMMIFCMTLVGYSTKAYSFLRESAKKCLPSVRTLRRYRKRVDGSPGFSTTAMNMIKQKVTEMHNESKQLFLSVSCDDMSIRYIFFAH